VLRWHTGVDALAQGNRILRLVEDDLAGEGEHLRGSVQVVNGAQACLLSFPRRLRGGRPHEHIEEI